MISVESGSGGAEPGEGRPADAEHARLRASEERFRLAFEGAPIGMLLLDLEPAGARVGKVNDAMCALLHLESSRMTGYAALDFVHGDDQARAEQALSSLAAGTANDVRDEFRLVRAKGEAVWGLVHAARLPSSESTPTVLVQVVDITRTKQSQQDLAHRAMHDPLTGLANRTVVQERLREVAIEAARSGRTGAVLFCDLNHFKEVNDAMGHHVGDEVLAHIAGRVEAQVRSTDSVGRLGGDEFVVVAHPVSLPEAERMSERIIRAVAEPVPSSGGICRVAMSIGLVLVTGAVDPGEVLRRADAAMYRVRNTDAAEGYVVDTA